MKKIIRYWNQNRLRIIIILIIIVFVFALISATNGILRKEDEEEMNQNTNLINIVGPKESVVTGEKISQEQTQKMPILNQFLDYCNEQKIEEAYSLLSEECKSELYPKLDDFKNNYYNQVFGGKRKIIDIDNWVGSIYKIKINEDPLTTGLYNENNIIQEYITITTSNGESKLNINGYIGRDILNNTNNYENVDITVKKADSYMEYQTFTYKIVNNSDNEILLDDKFDSNAMYIEDKNGTKYTAYTHEIGNEELKIGSKQTKEITIKYYNKYGSTKEIEKIVFSRIILNNNLNENRKYGELKIEL